MFISPSPNHHPLKRTAVNSIGAGVSAAKALIEDNTLKNCLNTGCD